MGECGCRVVSVSSVRQTEAWGYKSSNRFLNCVAKVETSLRPAELLAALQEIERRMGRTHKSQQGVYADREIDVDILLYNNEVICEANLQIPHPLLHKRKFVLEPLCEIAPLAVHPLLKKPVVDLWREFNS